MSLSLLNLTGVKLQRSLSRSPGFGGGAGDNDDDDDDDTVLPTTRQ